MYLIFNSIFMKEYCIIKAHQTDELEREVNQKLAEGWTLYGNLCVTGGGYQYLYCQAMLKEDKVSENHPEIF